ncbi:hypothetical protein AX14_001886 [Amanita brunnescens Koide BX004]|nr:hypothetical protein AX14_001886 [Amanita brunnescens Koide BX004]
MAASRYFQVLIELQRFKLHLRPPGLAAEGSFARDWPPLPSNKTVIDVFGDMLHYLFNATRQYIRESERRGVDVWNSVQDDIHFILSYPNGWEGKPLIEMQRAAVSAGLVPDAWEALERVRFITEGEACLHFCLSRCRPPTLAGCLDEGVMVAQCEEEIIEISTYTRTSGGSFKEIAPPQCLLEGSVFVTRRASQFLTQKLSGSRFENPDDIATMTSCFDKAAKMAFRDSSKPCFIRFGRSDNDAKVDIRAGTIKLSGQVFLAISVSHSVLLH